MSAQVEAFPEHLYKAKRGVPEFVQVPELTFVMVDGRGDPNTSTGYVEAVQVLYSVSYTLKFALRKDAGLQYRVHPLEGLWWAEDLEAFAAGAKATWQWTMMIAQPDVVTRALFEHARAEVARKKGLPGLDRARLARFEEGLCAQVLHVGPFSAEGPTIQALHEFIRAQGRSFDGPGLKHHEIYLSDHRRSAPEKWKTIIRQPVTPSSPGGT